MPKTNKLYASLLGVEEIQRLNLRLMELASFNRFDGYKVVKSLLDHKSLWQACLMDRESEYLVKDRLINLIKLRDMGDEQAERTGSIKWNVSTLFILAKLDLSSQRKLYHLAFQKWRADNVEWINHTHGSYLLGGNARGLKERILRVWWD